VLRGRFPHFFTAPNVAKYQAAVAQVAALSMRGREPFQGPLSVSIRFRLEPPKSMTKRERQAVLAGEVAYLGTRDVDNMGKAAIDAMNKIVWRDDVQICRLFLSKVASLKPGVDVRIEPLGEP
jgi:Holliday junction resolvase RusA-like endonuclease